MTVVGIIPARYGATRLPGKVLARIGNKTLIQLVFESAGKSARLDDLIVATDDGRVAEAVARFGGRAVLTSPEHRSGSDRIAEAASRIDCDIVVNIQGDEPLIRGEAIDAAVDAVLNHGKLEAATLATPIKHLRDADDPSVVKVVTDLEGNALYFSRSPIPHVRDGHPSGSHYLKHIGLYVYTKDLLMRFTGWPQTELEKLEKLEQLRLLGHGVRIRVIRTPHDSFGIDTHEDLERLKTMLR